MCPRSNRCTCVFVSLQGCAVVTPAVSAVWSSTPSSSTTHTSRAPSTRISELNSSAFLGWMDGQSVNRILRKETVCVWVGRFQLLSQGLLFFFFHFFTQLLQVLCTNECNTMKIFKERLKMLERHWKRRLRYDKGLFAFGCSHLKQI